MPLSTPISKAKNDETAAALARAAAHMKAEHEKNLKKNNDPFEGMDEEDIDDCIEELYGSMHRGEEFDEELEHGYCCTRDQLVYWLDKKYLDTTSYGEDLYNLLLDGDSKPTTEVVEASSDTD